MMYNENMRIQIYILFLCILSSLVSIRCDCGSYETDNDTTIGEYSKKRCVTNAQCPLGTVCKYGFCEVTDEIEDSEAGEMEDIKDIIEFYDNLELLDICISDCRKKECGDDGCGNMCGTCGKNMICKNGKCACDERYADCDRDQKNGCETNISDNVNDCGGCGNRCIPNSYCADFKCYCIKGFGNCDNNPSNGCETYLFEEMACGTDCNNRIKCSDTNGTRPYCDEGVCRLECNKGYADCNAKEGSSDGCEVDLNSLNSCGTNCNNIVKCPSDNGSNPYCDNGICRLYCNDGFADCNAAPGVSDGCETDIMNDVNNCGGCSRICNNEPGCESHQCICNNGICVKRVYDPDSKGYECNIDTQPCKEGYECVVIVVDQKDSRCYKDCTGDQNVCSSTQDCFSLIPQSNKFACFEVTEGIKGTFSDCLSYKEDESPESQDKAGSANIKFSLNGVIYNFNVCAGDYQISDNGENYWILDFIDTYQINDNMNKIVYIYSIAMSESFHTPGEHRVGFYIQPSLYEIKLDNNFNTIKAIFLGFGLDGIINLTQVGNGGKAPTSGSISDVLMVDYYYVICDNYSENPCQ